ncbi:unnamed protein product [Phaeothamnion confervicola]
MEVEYGQGQTNPAATQMDPSVVKDLFRVFKLNGLSARPDAIRALIRLLLREPDWDRALSAVLGGIKDKLERGDLKSSVVDVETVSSVVADLSKDDKELDEESLQYLDAFAMPRVTYDPQRKTLFVEDVVVGKRRMHALAAARPQMFRDRFLLAQQRVQRNKLFCRPVIASSRREHLQLTALDALVGARGTKVVLGMLTQPQEGRYCLEDLTSQVPLDFSQAGQTAGMFTEHSVVVVEGEMVDGVLRVHMMGLPPPEAREETLSVLGHTDLFGRGVTPQQQTRLAELGRRAADAMFVILSDVHLDRPDVLDKLRALFRGFAGLSPPPVFVLMGNFTSTPVSHAPESVGQLAGHFAALAAVIAETPRLAESARFVFVPGPNDPGAGNTLPRPPLPTLFTAALRELVKHTTFATNPCRLRFYAQEMVLFREDLLFKMQRHSVLSPSGPDDTPEASMDATEHLVRSFGEKEGDVQLPSFYFVNLHPPSQAREVVQSGSAGAVGAVIVKTLFDQGHLCPLPLAGRPICWQLDHTLALYPLPHVAVLADSADQYQWRYHGASAFNPGSFQADFSFIVYRPATCEVDFSSIE